MKIFMHDGKKKIMLRGSDGSFQICYKINTEDGTKWVPKLFYSDLPAMIQSVIKRKVSNSDARTLIELKEVLQTIQKELFDTFSTEPKQKSNRTKRRTT